MTPETINSIKEALAPIAEKIGQGAGYGWDILVHGQRMEGVVELIMTFTSMITISVLIYQMFKMPSRFTKFKRFTYDTELSYPDSFPLVMFFMSAAIIVLFIFTSINLYFGLMKVLAPEYTAIQFLLDLAHPSIK